MKNKQLKDRDNREHFNPYVINTIHILNVITQNAPECCQASDIAQILEIEPSETEEILINLCIAEIVRETEHGFQTLGNKIEKFTPGATRVMDAYLTDSYGSMPRLRDANGRWL